MAPKSERGMKGLMTSSKSLIQKAIRQNQEKMYTKKTNEDSKVTATKLDDFVAGNLLTVKHVDTMKLNSIEFHKSILIENTKIPIDQVTKIPRPVRYDTGRMDNYEELEKNAFAEWCKKMALAKSHYGSSLTPYERRLSYWKCLWLTISHCEIILYIVDIRDALLYVNKDFEDFIIENNKTMVLVLNKADLIEPNLRKEWLDYFEAQGMNAICFSCTIEAVESEAATQYILSRDDLFRYLWDLHGEIVKLKESMVEEGNCMPSQDNTGKDGINLVETSKVKNQEKYFEHYQEHEMVETKKNVDFTLSIGAVGYPNVGKSSICNKVADSTISGVSTRPGKTRHIQTLVIKSWNIVLFDCPGLTIPCFGMASEMLLLGVTPLQSLDLNCITAIGLLATVSLKNLSEYFKFKHDSDSLLQDFDSDDNYHSRGVRRYYESNTYHEPRSIGMRVLRQVARKRKLISGGVGGQLNLFSAAKLIIEAVISGKISFCLPPDVNRLESIQDANKNIPSELNENNLHVKSGVEKKEATSSGNLNKHLYRKFIQLKRNTNRATVKGA